MQLRSESSSQADIESALTTTLRNKALTVDTLPSDSVTYFAGVQRGIRRRAARRGTAVVGVATLAVASTLGVIALRNTSGQKGGTSVQVAASAGPAKRLFPTWLPAGVGRMAVTELADQPADLSVAVLHGKSGDHGFVVSVQELTADPHGVPTLAEVTPLAKDSDRNLTWAQGRYRFVLRFNERVSASKRVSLANEIGYDQATRQVTTKPSASVTFLFNGDPASLAPTDSWRLFSNADSRNSIIEIRSTRESASAQTVRAGLADGSSTTVRGAEARIMRAADGTTELSWIEDGTALAVRSRLSEKVIRKVAESLSPTTDARWTTLRSNARIESVVADVDPLVTVLSGEEGGIEWSVVAARGFDNCLNVDVRVGDDRETVCVPTTGSGLLAAPKFVADGVEHRLLVTAEEVDAVRVAGAAQETYGFIAESVATGAYTRVGFSVVRAPSSTSITLLARVEAPVTESTLNEVNESVADPEANADIAGDASTYTDIGNASLAAR